MAIDFNQERWITTRKNAEDWWSGKLDRPLIQIKISGRSPGKAEPKISGVLWYKAAYDLSVTADEIVDLWDYQLSCQEFLGDSFPAVWPNFGAGVLAAFMGAKAEPAEETVWFHPDKNRELDEIRFSIASDNIWLKRIQDICRVAMERWEGLVQVGMTDLGGNLDVLSTFRPGEKLLMDLIDSPDEVKRLIGEEHKTWWEAFDKINAVLQPVNPGYTAWTPIFSGTPSYMLQSDFSYMIGPKMFDEFVKPELEASCKRLDRAFYHLDGVGELPHLDSLLSIRELKGVQWVPGDGKPQGEEWPDVYRKIIKAGKRAQFVGNWRNFDKLVNQIGGAENFIVFGEAPQDQRRDVESFLKRYNAI